MTGPQRYRKKPVVIEAVLYDTTNGGPTSKWCHGKERLEHQRDSSTITEWIDIPTLEGVMRASIGDYIIKGVQGEFYPCKPRVFDATYEQA